jgi:hypothetical protein
MSEDYVSQLVERVEDTAEWRAEKAQQYPDDKRNEHSSDALRALAERLGALPRDGRSARAYNETMERALEFDLGISISETEREYIGRYGFDYPQDGDPEAFIEMLMEAIRDELSDAEEAADEAKREAEYKVAAEAADEQAKADAAEAAKEAAEEAAKEAAAEAYKKAHDKIFKKTYDDVYKAALIDELNRRGE